MMKKYGTPEKIEVLHKEGGIINRFLRKLGKKSVIDLDEKEKEDLKEEMGESE